MNSPIAVVCVYVWFMCVQHIRVVAEIRAQQCESSSIAFCYILWFFDGLKNVAFDDPEVIM